jgi:LL-H family phage holin
MFQQVATALIPYLIPFLIAGCAYGYQLLAQRLPEKQRAALDQFAGIAVAKIEQQYSSASGPNKKQLAIELIGDLFKSFGLPIPSTGAIDAAIEAAVFAINQAQPAQDDPAPLAKDAPHA